MLIKRSRNIKLLNFYSCSTVLSWIRNQEQIKQTVQIEAITIISYFELMIQRYTYY